MKIRSLSGRISILLGIAATLVLGVAAVLMDHMVDAEMGRRLDDSVLSEARALATLADFGPEGVRSGEFNPSHSRLLGDKTRAAFAIRCANGAELRSTPAPPRYPPDWAVSANPQPKFADVDNSGRNLRAVWFRFSTEVSGNGSSSHSKGDDCRLLLMQSHAELDEILIVIDAILLAAPMLALLAVLVLSPGLVRRGLQPLVALGEEMRGVGPQAVGQRLRSTGTRELEPLVARFNEVLARMDEGVTRERQFAGALAHETRTRLAELRALVEVEQRYPSERPLGSLLDEIGSIGAELENTVSALLLLTRLDAGIESLDLQLVDLDALIARQLAQVDATVQRRGLRVTIEQQPDPVSLVADPSLLAIIVGNLLGNASSYAPVGSVITVQHDRDVLIVANQAPDLATDEVTRFGQRFWSKHHGADGHAGLGLALAGAAAAAMGFNLDFRLDAHQYLRASLRWHGDSDGVQA